MRVTPIRLKCPHRRIAEGPDPDELRLSDQRRRSPCIGNEEGAGSDSLPAPFDSRYLGLPRLVLATVYPRCNCGGVPQSSLRRRLTNKWPCPAITVSSTPYWTTQRDKQEASISPVTDRAPLSAVMGASRLDQATRDDVGSGENELEGNVTTVTILPKVQLDLPVQPGVGVLGSPTPARRRFPSNLAGESRIDQQCTGHNSIVATELRRSAIRNRQRPGPRNKPYQPILAAEGADR